MMLRRMLGSAGLGVVGVAVLLGTWPRAPVAHNNTLAALPPMEMEGVHAEAFDACRRRLTVEAARGYGSRKRLGFLQTALVPTIELEQVKITRFHDDGRIEQTEAPDAVIDWTSKRLSSRSGKPLFSTP